jgi:MFS transporter, ACS family, tartrate transporter
MSEVSGEARPAGAAGSGAEFEKAVIAKVMWRIIPFMMVLYFVAFLDRVNIGFAALTMNADLGFSATVFGAGAGIFFLGYFLFEVPSNVALEKYGARRWIARIMFTWGIISCLMAFVEGPVSFYILRFLLGAAEAGFFPGMILYFTYWFPARQRGKIVGAFMIAVPLSNVLGAPLSTAIMSIEGLGLAGWQWLFIIEGFPAVLLAFVVLRYLTDKPANAAWLTAEEKATLVRMVEDDAPSRDAGHSHTVKDALGNGRIWFYGLIYFGMTVGIYGLGFWLPQIVNGFGGLARMEVGFITAIPYIAAAAGMFFCGRHSDKVNERIWHIVGPAFIGAGGFLFAAYFDGAPLLAFIGITIGAAGVFSGIPAFWTLPTAMLTGTAAAVGIAMVNSIGNTGGYFGPTIIGYFKDADQSYRLGMLALAGFIAMTGMLVLLSHRRGRGGNTTMR